MKLLPASIQSMTSADMMAGTRNVVPMITPDSVSRAYQLTTDIGQQNFRSLYGGSGMSATVQGMTPGMGQLSKGAMGGGLGEMSQWLQDLVKTGTETSFRITEALLTPEGRPVGPYAQTIAGPPPEVEVTDRGLKLGGGTGPAILVGAAVIVAVLLLKR
jgi:hypothetical protein